MIGCGVPHFLFANSLRRNKIHFCGEGRAVVERLADPVNQHRDVGRCNGMTPWFEHIQRIAVAEEDRALAFADDHL